MANHKLRNGIIVLAVGAIIWFMPVPGGLTAQAWRLFAVFVATILGFILHLWSAKISVDLWFPITSSYRST